MDDDVALTSLTSCGGCAAKWGAGMLRDLVAELPTADPGGLLIGLAPFDDAAVVELTPEVALVSTTDFFPPVVDDPGDFGAIAAANACSDVFAMGGRVVVALNLAALPEDLPRPVIAAIFAAAAQTVVDAGGTIAGGHTIRSPEPIFGLAVQGVVHPDRILAKGGARPGDALVLSKPLGTGIALAGGSAADVAAATAGMRSLNRAAAEALVDRFDAVRATTDVTGYGLLGHSWEMAERSDAVLRLDGERLPLYPGVLAAAEAGVRTGGDARNRSFVGQHAVRSTAEPAIDAVAHDPQTSGGLLAAVDPAIVDELASAGFVPIGEVVEGPAGVELR